LLKPVQGLETGKHAAPGKPRPAEMRTYPPAFVRSWGAPWPRIEKTGRLALIGKISASLLATGNDDLQNPAPFPDKTACLLEQKSGFGRCDSKRLASMVKASHVAFPQGRLVTDEGYGLEKAVTVLQTTIQNRKAFTVPAVDQQG
jgi:hypothetical protein